LDKMEAKNDFGKGIAIMLVVMTIFFLSFDHYNSTITGAAPTRAYSEIYGGWIVFFLIVLSIFIILEYEMKKKRQVANYERR